MKTKLMELRSNILWLRYKPLECLEEYKKYKNQGGKMLLSQIMKNTDVSLFWSNFDIIENKKGE